MFLVEKFPGCRGQSASDEVETTGNVPPGFSLEKSCAYPSRPGGPPWLAAGWVG